MFTRPTIESYGLCYFLNVRTLIGFRDYQNIVTSTKISTEIVQLSLIVYLYQFIQYSMKIITTYPKSALKFRLININERYWRNFDMTLWPRCSQVAPLLEPIVRTLIFERRRKLQFNI